MKNERNCALVGVPDHAGVIHVGGRIGAAQGPKAFRAQFDPLRSRDAFLEGCKDVGDVLGITNDVARNHQVTIDRIREVHPEKGVSIVIGGGHDHGFTHLKGVRDALSRGSPFTVGCINIDAHLDVRPVRAGEPITSGSPFFLAIEEDVLRGENLTEFGIQRVCNREELFTYAKEHQVQIIEYEDCKNSKLTKLFQQALKRLASRCDGIVISVDLDAVAGSHAPGVSAPPAEGFLPEDLFQLMKLSAKQKKVRSLGIFELNPFHDIDGRTARLGAHAVWHFLRARWEV